MLTGDLKAVGKGEGQDEIVDSTAFEEVELLSSKGIHLKEVSNV